MKKSELRNIIKEELKKALKEVDYDYDEFVTIDIEFTDFKKQIENEFKNIEKSLKKYDADIIIDIDTRGLGFSFNVDNDYEKEIINMIKKNKNIKIIGKRH